MSALRKPYLEQNHVPRLLELLHVQVGLEHRWVRDGQRHKSLNHLGKPANHVMGACPLTNDTELVFPNALHSHFVARQTVRYSIMHTKNQNVMMMMMMMMIMMMIMVSVAKDTA